MGCTSSKESAPPKSDRGVLYGSDTSLPNQRYLSCPPRKLAASDKITNVDKQGSAEAPRPKETFEAYARRGLIRQSALLPETTPSKRNEHLMRKKRVGGYEKYMRE